MKKFYTLSLVLLASIASFGQVVISQVYGGGGNTGATYTHDFIELFNRGTTAQSLNGWSIQYASAAGPSAAPNNFWATTVLPNVTIQPGKYFLIQQATNAAVGIALPTPDFNGICATCTTDFNGTGFITGGIAMAGGSGKLILVNVVAPQTGSNPTGSQIVDKVGYGGSTVTGFEGTGPTGTVLTSTTAATRKSNGCIDTDSNPSDFEALLPNPRNSATAANTCAPASTPKNEIAGLSIFPNPTNNGLLYVTSDSSVQKAVTVFDVLGKQVLKASITDQAINVANLKSGVYFVKVTEDGKTATRKLVINN